MIRSPLEAHTRREINQRLTNLGWILNERDPKCNVTQEQARTEKQNKLFAGRKPDYVLYEAGTTRPIAIIEAKRPGQDLENAMKQAIDYYATPLNTPIVFAFNDTFVMTKYTLNGRPLKIDGEELQDFIDQFTTLRFINEGSEIYSTPKGLAHSREELLKIFKDTNNLLRKEGLRDGYERFSAFAEILFLKLVDEHESLKEFGGGTRTIEKRYCWNSFINRYSNQDLVDYIKDSVWKKLRKIYGDIFAAPFSIRNGNTLDQIVELINPINLTSTDTDIKGDAFEYFLKNVTNGNKDLGEYFTPRHITRTMVRLVKPQYGETIYDPFCGTGGFLLEAFKYLSLRIDTTKKELIYQLRNNTIFGREITSTARISKMNMVLFGDGHSNIEQMDSLENPVTEKYDIILSNIPYSQSTEYGAFYPIPTKNGDSICMQHIWNALKPNGRAAVIVPETFLYKDGVHGKTREMIARNSKKLAVFSLPRGVFIPYTPTKTNIIYFQKGGEFKNVHFFVVHNDGFELNTSRKSIEGNSDIQTLLSQFDEPEVIKGKANIVSRDEIQESGSWNLRPYYYMEDIPEINNESVYLSDGIIALSGKYVNPREEPDKMWNILEVSQNGIFLSDSVAGSEFTQDYQRVCAGDIVYNPYRVNIGSIGVVPLYLDKALVSPAYVVFKTLKPEKFPPLYLISVLKSKRYLRVIMNYALSSARASLPYSELLRIKIPEPGDDTLNKINELNEEFNISLYNANNAISSIDSIIDKSLS
ncbi:MAG: N-6 DNA methylase [Candidatus Cloacimonetes bacterium]|nr:N-6 DNA methylase [Candidatus Cloacimonadota bacterium]MCF7884622.1 N-6 DNA methylase [Candidatus Cloacimonadota bacterium]MCF8021030.1 N-6 DNA methylase [Vallitaleaceae bacterium]